MIQGFRIIHNYVTLEKHLFAVNFYNKEHPFSIKGDISLQNADLGETDIMKKLKLDARTHQAVPKVKLAQQNL